jgi:hypothetical protein
MAFEIDAFKLDLTPPRIAWGHPVWALLIIDGEATAADRNDIITMSGLKLIKKRARIPGHIKNTYLEALYETSLYIDWDDHDYYIGRVSDYDRIFTNFAQIETKYEHLLVRCYRLLGGAQYDPFERMVAIILKFRNLLEQMYETCEKSALFPLMTDNLRQIVEASETKDWLEALERGLGDEWIYVAHRFCEIFSALALSTASKTHLEAELDDIVACSTVPSFLNEAKELDEELILAQQCDQAEDERPQPVFGHVTDESVERPALSEEGTGTALGDVGLDESTEGYPLSGGDE